MLLLDGEQTAGFAPQLIENGEIAIDATPKLFDLCFDEHRYGLTFGHTNATLGILQMDTKIR
jgi:hypothetical protein